MAETNGDPYAIPGNAYAEQKPTEQRVDPYRIDNHPTPPDAGNQRVRAEMDARTIRPPGWNSPTATAADLNREQEKVIRASFGAKVDPHEVALARQGTLTALDRDWHNIQTSRIAQETRPVGIDGNTLLVEVKQGSKFAAPEMSRALDALGREDVSRVAVRIVPEIDRSQAQDQARGMHR